MYRLVQSVFMSLAVMLSLGAPRAFAQEGTPDTPHIPSGCYSEPVSILSVLEAANKAEEYWDYRGGIYLESVNEAQLEKGALLSQEDAAGIEETLYQLVACANAMSPLQMLGLFTTEYQAILALEAIDERNFDTVAQYVPLLATQTSDLQGIPELNIVDAWYDVETNKIVHAVVEPYLAESEEVVRFLVTFQWDIDRWVITWVRLIE